MAKFKLIGKFDEEGDTFFTGLVETDVKDDIYLNLHLSKYMLGVPVEEFINISQHLQSGHLEFEFEKNEEVALEAEKSF